MGTLSTPIGETHLIAIGRVTVNFALLEYHLSKVVWAAIAGDLTLGRIVTAELSFKNLVALASSSYRHRVSAPARRKHADSVFKRAEQAETKRNGIIHSLWVAGRPTEDPLRLKVTAKRKRGLAFDSDQVPAAKIEAVAQEISEVAFDVIDLETELMALPSQ